MLVTGMVCYLLEVSRDGSQHVCEGVGLGLWQGLAYRTETDQLISKCGQSQDLGLSAGI